MTAVHSTAASRPTTTPLILVVDDDDTQREYFASCLVREGFRVEIAAGAADALRMQPQIKPDVVVMDVQMPGMDGFDILENWRSANTTNLPPVIFVSSLEERDRYRRALQLGAADYLVKPVPRTTLLTAVRDALASWKETAAMRTEAGQLAVQTASQNAPADPAPRQARRADSERPSASGYEVIRTLGQGGNATVHLALHRPTRTQRALKVLKLGEAPDSEAIMRFIQEASAVEGLDHPGIAAVLDHGISDDGLYLAMEYLPGGDLRSEIRQGLSPVQAVTYALRILDALAVVHARGLVHRDLKPANLMLRGPGDLVLTDFGIAKRINGASRLTRADHVVGTLQYMSPEQATGRPVDARTDLYATGVVLTEMLTGMPPFRGASLEEIVAAILHAPVPQLGTSLNCIQPAIDALLAKRPEDRPRSADEAHALLSRALHGLASRL